MYVKGSVEESRSSTACTIFLNSLHGGIDNSLVVSESHVGVGTEHEYFLAAHHDFCVLMAVDLSEVRIDTQLHELLRFPVLLESFL